MNTKPSHSAGKAALFAFIPGMGAVYNRQYDKAVAHFGIFAALFVFAGEVEIFGMAAFVFYVFSIMDAYRSAQSLAESGRYTEAQDHQMNLPVWGSSLVFMGILFFLNNLGVVSLRQLSRHSWPFLFVAAGLYLIFRYYTSADPQQVTPPATPPAAAAAPESGTTENEGQ